MISSTGLGCGALGAQLAGRRFRWDLIRCGRCRRKLRRAESPLWYFTGTELEPQCVDCARVRHSGCPCRYVERTQPTKKGTE